MIRSVLLAVLLFAPLGILLSQTDSFLPRGFSADEKLQLLTQKFGPVVADGITDPPSIPVRAMGEWEELQALLITWQASNNGLRVILTEIVRAAREECRVVICCDNASTLTAAQNFLISKNVDITTNVEFLIVPNNSIWIRDYGPNCVYGNDVDSLFFVDWRYNRVTRTKDDTLATTVSRYLDIPLYTTSKSPTDLVHTGGNFMSDGLGTSFSSRLILSENAPGNPYGASVKTESQIDGIMQSFMGVNRYVKMDVLPYDAIHHIDMHMKLLDEETLLVGKYPDGVADGPQIEANIQYVLNNYKTAFGTPFQLVRVPMPPDAIGRYPNTNGDYRTYANAVFVNKTILVPFYEAQFDTTAQRIWEETMPGYRIVGIDCNAIIGSLGAIHCITKEVGVSDPLHIVHQEPACMDNLNYLEYPVWANLAHRSGIASAKIFYTTDLASPWQTVDLPAYLLNDTSWNHRGFIPKQAAGSTVYYYIEATSNSGKTLTRPLTAPSGYWSFCVTETTGTAALQPATMTAIYPNPASAITVIPVEAAAPVFASLCLYNTLGQLVHTIYEGEIAAGLSNYFIDAARYPAGAYWVELRTATQTSTQQLIIR